MLTFTKWKLQDVEPGKERDLTIAHPEFIDHFWMTADVPGDVHSTLIEKGIIDDPFYGHNDLKCRFVEEKTWWYRTEFAFDEELLPEEKMELTFEGLDTFATIYLNGVELASTENMFVPLTLDVTRELVRGRNVIAVKFDPVHKHVGEKELTYWSGFGKERIWTRKAQMNFGWDWGPRLVTVGIWKPVYLKKRKAAKWDSVFAKTVSLLDSSAVVEVNFDAISFVPRRSDYSGQSSVRNERKLEARLRFTDRDMLVETTVPLERGRGTARLEVANPKLWWTHDLGTPHLYHLEAELLVDGEVVDVYETPFGIRTIEVLQTNEDGTNAFTFCLNGVKVFAKGANWIPVDSFIGSAPDSRYEELISLSRLGNMNMLRVWGGGIYEKDIFYAECDRQGLLVWQDFMFACALYPDYNVNYMANVEREIVHVVKHLRNHASLALWCGNNENDWLYEQMASSKTISTPFYGEKIYHVLMPTLLEDLDPSRLYWPSSPYGGNDHNAAEEGDRHNWQVWHGNVYPRKFGEPERIDYSVEGVSFKNFASCFSTFVSEFGMHAAANYSTLASFIPEGELYWNSGELAYRNKDYHHPKGILLMEGYTGIPRSLDEYLNFSMLTQAEGLKYGIEHYRRNKFGTSGTLVWQLNDCWPGTSWSMIDYHLLPKASYYYGQRFFHPLLLTAKFETDGRIEVFTVNDTREKYQDTLCAQVVDFRGNIVWEGEQKISVEPNGLVHVTTLNSEDILRGAEAREVMLQLSSASGKAPVNRYYFMDHKDLRLPDSHLTVDVNRATGTVTVSADLHTRMVSLDVGQPRVTYSDNFFDLQAGETRVVHVGNLAGDEVRLESLRVRTINAVRVDLHDHKGEEE